MAETTHTSKSRGASALLRNLPLIAILVAAIFGFFLLRDTLSFETLRENREALLAYRDDNFVLTVLAFVAAYVIIVGFSLPGATVATLTGGFLFGTLAGALFSVIGATLGACVIFLAARHGLGDRLRARMDASEGAVRKVKRGLDENQWSMLFFIRLVPIVPFFVANLIPAFLGVPLYRFALSTFLGIIPGALVYASVGAGLGSVFEQGGTPDLGIVFEPRILLPLLALAALALLPVAIKVVTGRKGPGA
ncbi:TVP38/TMEM64 family protein [Sulfitobacter sp. D35]|uniref:TVP38/TMEM64 family protein n=1 Tax=Sulfitobacter sp. D35 TaxID=3083252 RepID=UPI00296FDB58|nr:TVP38/TMEM64 family protein [Sulfitobacter sp. D35]MDW4500477.1 TVP38/TMEM64 family protein [Sulfitobacter sp. D35]